MVNNNFKLRASVSAIVAALLMGQTAIAMGATTKATKTTHASKKAKTSHTHKSAQSPKPAVNTAIAKPTPVPVVTPVAEADTQSNP